MKLLVKVIEAEYSDAAQIAIVDLTLEFLAAARMLVGEAELISHELKAPVSLRIENNVGEYFMISHRDLPTLIQAAEGRMADWDEFNHLVLEDESWSRNWKRIELSDRCTVIDQSGIYFKGTSNGVDYLTASLVGGDLASIQLPEQAHALSAAAI